MFALINSTMCLWQYHPTMPPTLHAALSPYPTHLPPPACSCHSFREGGLLCYTCALSTCPSSARTSEAAFTTHSSQNTVTFQDRWACFWQVIIWWWSEANV